MRWDALFDDLEAQFAAENRLGHESEISERARVETAGVELHDRLRGSAGSQLGVLLASGTLVRGRLAHVGSEWLVLNEGMHQWLVPFAAVVSYQGLGRLAQGARSKTEVKLGLASALRGLARDRAELAVHMLGVPGRQQQLGGVIDRVGRDHFDLAVVAAGEVRRAGNVSSVMTVPFASIAALRSHRGERI